MMSSSDNNGAVDDPLSMFLNEAESGTNEEALKMAEDMMNSIVEGMDDIGLTHSLDTFLELDEDDAIVVNGFGIDENQEKPGVEETTEVPETPNDKLRVEEEKNIETATRNNESETHTKSKTSGKFREPGVIEDPLLNHATSMFSASGLDSIKKVGSSALAQAGLGSLFQKAAANLSSSFAQASTTTTACSDSPTYHSTQPTVVARMPPVNEPSSSNDHLQLLGQPSIQSQLLSLALQGGKLLEGERIILFLPQVVNVATSSSPVSGVASSATIAAATATAARPPQLWAMCITFYRVIVFNYTMAQVESMAMAPGTVGGGASDSARSASYTAGLDNAIMRAGLSRQWQYYHSSGLEHFVIQMPLGAIDRVEKGDVPLSMASNSTVLSNALLRSNSNVDSPENGGTAQQTIVLYDKGGSNRWIRFTTTHYADAIRAHEALSTYAFPGKRNLGYLFAFESRREQVLAAASLKSNARCILKDEFARMGIPTPQSHQSNHAWVMTHANVNYNVCSSYPSLLVVPTCASFELAGDSGRRILSQTATFRSERRVPALAWGTGHDAASIWRCSQPKVGLGSNRNAADEAYLKALSDTAAKFVHNNTLKLPPAYTRLLTGANDADGDVLSFLKLQTKPILRIMDLRPKSAAMANRTQGYGYESSSNYPHCQVNFYNIANIHGVRDSLAKLSALAMSPVTPDVQFSALVESTGWLTMARIILNAAWQCAALVNFHRLPVLLHCSHGWDRTSQVSALAQLMLDPYYRTMAGFATLVEKEFGAFGHPFHLRCGHGEGTAGDFHTGSVGSTPNSGQRSPVLLQFLDCTWQLVNQHPTFFEFNSRYLMAVADEIYSCRFGTFLCDNERERVAAGIYERTYSLWDHLDGHGQVFTNHYYSRVTQLLIPPLPCVLRQVTLWSDYHLRYSPRAYLACLPRELAPSVLPYDTLFCASDQQEELYLQVKRELDLLKQKCHAQEAEIERYKKLLKE